MTTQHEFFTRGHLLKKGMAKLHNASVFLDNVKKDVRKEFEGKKEGDKIYIKRPLQFNVKRGRSLSEKSKIIQGTMSFNLDSQLHEGVSITSKEATTDFDGWVKDVTMPVFSAFAQVADSEIAQQGQKTWNVVSPVGTDAKKINSIFSAQAIMNRNAVPMGGGETTLALSQTLQQHLLEESASMFVAPTNAKAYEKGQLGYLSGFKTRQSAIIPSHTVGEYSTSKPKVKGASQKVGYDSVKDDFKMTLKTNGWLASKKVLHANDIITIAGVYAVNPVANSGGVGAKLVYSSIPQKFLVEADVTSDNSGNADIIITPPIIDDTAYQTVSAAAKNEAVINVVGDSGTTYEESLIFHPDALRYVSVPLDLPSNQRVAEFDRREFGGVSIRVLKYFDGKEDEETVRFDILGQAVMWRPEFAVRIRTALS